MSVSLCPTFGVGWQGFTSGGLPLNAGLIYTYAAGGTTPQATYTTYLGNVQNANPIQLGADGRPPSEIWLTQGVSYRFDLTDSLGNLIKTYDNIVPITNGSATLVNFLQNGTGAVTRTVNSKLTDIVSVLDFGADKTGATDSTAAVQAAITSLASSPFGVVYFPRGTYKIATFSGSTVTLPGSSAPMGYCVNVPTNVALWGEGESSTILVGDHTYRTTPINTSQKIMFNLGAGTGGNFFFYGMQFQSCMIPVYGAGIFSGFMKYCAFGNCALPMILQRAERFEWHAIDIDVAAGIMIGSWYNAGHDGDTGGWANKCTFSRLSYQRSAADNPNAVGFTSYETSIDTFFDNNFFNNASGTITVPYRGVVGILMNIVGRYNYPQAGNSFIGPFFHYGSPRPMIYGGPEYVWNGTGPFFFERCGFTDSTIATIFGSAGQADPWNASSRMNALINPYLGTAASTFSGIYATSCAAIDVVTPSVSDNWGQSVPAASNAQVINPKTYAELMRSAMVEALAVKRVNLTYSTSITIDFTLGNSFTVPVTDNVNFSLNFNVNTCLDGQVVTITIRAGAAMGTITWDTKFKMSAWTNPNNNYSRSVTFRFDGSNMIQISQTGVDVPN